MGTEEGHARARVPIARDPGYIWRLYLPIPKFVPIYFSEPPMCKHVARAVMQVAVSF